jgi:CheY-like chemotaxis protein
MGEGLRVLVVEDHPDDILILRRAFSKGAPGVPLHFAQSGDEALAYLKGLDRFADRTLHPLPTLLLLDLKLPGIDGFDVIQWVRNESAFRDIPIVVLTSSGQPSDVSRARQMGANAYHVKPNDANALIGMVEGLRMYWSDKRLEAWPPPQG